MADSTIGPDIGNIMSGKPLLLQQRSSNCFIMATVTFGIFTDSFLYSVIIPVLPYCLETRYQIPKDQTGLTISAMVTSYGAALLVTSPIIALIADGRKTRWRSYLSGLCALFGAIMMLLLGSNLVVLILARILQGISSAVVWVVGLALLVDTVGPQSIGRAVGCAALGSSFAILMGPLTGGLIYDHVGLDGIYCICLVLVLMDLWMRLLLIERHTAKTWLDIDNQLTGGEETLETDSETPLLLFGRLRLILSLLSSSRLLCAIFSTLMSAILISIFEASIPLYVQSVLGMSSTGTGLVFAAVIIPNFAAPVTGWLSDRYGARWIVTAGYVLLCPLIACLCFVASNRLSEVVLFCVLLVGIGFCYSLVTVPILSEYTRIVAQKETDCPGLFGSKGVYAQAYGLYNIAYAGGVLIGPVCGRVLMQRFGWTAMTSSLGVCCCLTALVTGLWCGRRDDCRNSVTEKSTPDV